MSQEKPNTIIYIDGYNWYHAIFKHYPEWKWLNIQSFFEMLRPHDNVISVKMFSAMIREPNANERQNKYFSALRTFPKMKIILGAFKPREVTCRGACGQIYMVDEEKKTDVNMAVEIMADATGGKCESICVVSGDSDIQPVVEWVAKNIPTISITTYLPALPKNQDKRRLDYYRHQGLPVDCRFLPLNGIPQHQLKHNVKLPDNTFACKPANWNAPP